MASVLFLAALAAPVMAGTATHGGAVAGAQIVRVSSLADAGPGSLRGAVQQAGPKVIVFDVGGVIQLASDLKIAIPNTTIAGQSAPAPVTLTGASLRIRANDVVVQHIAVRPGPGATPESNDNRDGVTIGGGKRPVRDIRVENVSLSWALDEGASVGGGASNVTFRNSIVAESLSNAGHPKGRHSMGMLINNDNQAVAVTGNLFAANMYRNPVIARGGSVFVGYNLIVDPGRNAIHFYDAAGATPLRVSLVGNVVQPGSDTAGKVTAVLIPETMAAKLPDASLYVSQNRMAQGALANPGDFPLAERPPVGISDKYAAAGNVGAAVLRDAGARPAARDAVDARIVSQAAQGTIRIIDDPAEVGGLPPSAPVHNAAAVPANPFDVSGRSDLLRIEAWLCQRHREVGGPATPECPGAAQDYRNLLQLRLTERR
ncbi:MAG TPA: hypothetical protein VJL82_05050 [Rhizomicrobium sp.]|nr:hypothetical protein [Rhizomicrobium sp.]